MEVVIFDARRVPQGNFPSPDLALFYERLLLEARASFRQSLAFGRKDAWAKYCFLTLSRLRKGLAKAKGQSK